MSRRARLVTSTLMTIALSLGLSPTLARAMGGSTDVTIRRLEERATGPIAALAQTGVGGQSWWLIAGGIALIALALVAWRIARGRSQNER